MFIARPVPSTNRGLCGLAAWPSGPLPGQVGADAAAEAPGGVGIDLQLLLDPVDGRGGVHARVLVDERPADQGHVVGARVPHVVAAFGQRAVVLGADQQVGPALAAVRTGQAEVADPAEPDVVEEAQSVGRCLEHQWSLRQVVKGPEVDGVGVRGQEQRPGIHQLGEDQHVAIRDAGVLEPLPDGEHGHPLDGVHERLDAVQVVQVVTQRLRGLTRRVAVGELQRPDPGLHARRGRDRCGHRRLGCIVGGHRGLLRFGACE